MCRRELDVRTSARRIEGRRWAFALSVALMVAVPLTAPSSAGAHSGGTDANGCHAGSRPYHCHNGGTPSPNGGVPTPSAGVPDPTTTMAPTAPPVVSDSTATMAPAPAPAGAAAPAAAAEVQGITQEQAATQDQLAQTGVSWWTPMFGAVALLLLLAGFSMSRAGYEFLPWQSSRRPEVRFTVERVRRRRRR
jgi:hypothetical protein